MKRLTVEYKKGTDIHDCMEIVNDHEQIARVIPNLKMFLLQICAKNTTVLPMRAWIIIILAQSEDSSQYAAMSNFS